MTASKHAHKPVKSTDFENRCRPLFLRAQAGDKKAYQELLIYMYDYIKMSVRKNFSNPEIAEDLVQDILIAFHKAKHTYDPKKPFKPWISAIIRFKVIDQLRKTYKLKEREVFVENSETFDSPATNMQTETMIDLERALKQLPEKQRRSFSLLKLDGLSVKEASIETGWSEASIKVSAHRAYKLLRKFFGEEGI